MDIVDANTRSRMMSGIGSKNTRPELAIRKGLHARGFRFRLHPPGLPGKPDLSFPRYHAVIFVHGCFWHRHECSYFKWPQTRPEFWKEKINSNVSRDLRNIKRIKGMGLRVLVVWECALRDKSQNEIDQLLDHISLWLRDGKESISLSEKRPREGRSCQSTPN